MKAVPTLAVLNEALRCKFERTGDERYRVANFEERALVWEDLMTFRRKGGLQQLEGFLDNNADFNGGFFTVALPGKG